MHTAVSGEHAISTVWDRVMMVDGAVGLALTMVDYLSDKRVREAVRAEFAASGGRLEQLLTPPASAAE